MRALAPLLINWYSLNKRDLPWRNTQDPYRIWLSEIILQQTRVAQGLPYYLKFVEAYPTVSDLAAASETEVLKLWQGLGYYSRARNMLKTAQLVESTLGGKFPKRHAELLQLKGIGPYTAAAVASFSSNEKVAVVDGNVYRVLSRIFGIDLPIDSTSGKKEFARLASELISDDAATYNHAIMDFGATLCKPKVPLCNECPFSIECHARKENIVDQLPVKSKKTKVLTRHFNYLVFDFEGHIYLKERASGDVWQGLYDFPLIESTEEVQDPAWIYGHQQFESFGSLKPELSGKSTVYRHLLSHREILATFWEFKLSSPIDQAELISEDTSNPIGKPIPQLLVNYLSRRKMAE